MFLSRSNQLRALSLLWLCLLGGVVLVMSLSVVWLGDDVDYRFFIDRSIWNSDGPLDTPARFFASQANHWFFVNGRSVAHALVQLFCGVLGHTAFAVVNAMVYPMFAWLLLRVSGIRRPLSHPASMLTVVALIPLVFTTKMMPTCQIGFVWMFALNLWWWLGMLRVRHLPVWLYYLMLLLSVLAGNSQEGLSIGVSAAMALWLIHRRLKAPRRIIGCMIAYWLGTLTVCLTPATISRATTIAVAPLDSLIYLCMSLRVCYLLAICVSWLGLRHRLSFRRLWRKNALLLIAIAVLLGFNLWVGVYSNRQLFGLELLALIVLLRILPHGRLSLPWLVVVTAAATGWIIVQLDGAWHIRRQWLAITELHRSRTDGRVYFDRVQPSVNPILREYRIYEQLAGFGMLDGRRTICKELRTSHPEGRTAQIHPAITHNRTFTRDTLIKIAPQQYIAIIIDSAYNRFGIVERHVITGQRDTLRDLSQTRPCAFDTRWMALLIAPYRPFRVIDTVLYLR